MHLGHQLPSLTWPSDMQNECLLSHVNQNLSLQQIATSRGTNGAFAAKSHAPARVDTANEPLKHMSHLSCLQRRCPAQKTQPVRIAVFGAFLNSWRHTLHKNHTFPLWFKRISRGHKEPLRVGCQCDAAGCEANERPRHIVQSSEAHMYLGFDGEQNLHPSMNPMIVSIMSCPR